MRHRKGGKKLGRTSSHRWAMFRNMVTSLLEHEKIQTTDVKAKELRKLAEKMITLGKRGDLHARRLANAVIRKKTVARKLFEELAPRYSDRQGGYVRILKAGYRPGDGAPISVVAFLPAAGDEKKKKKALTKSASSPKPPEKETPAQKAGDQAPVAPSAKNDSTATAELQRKAE